MSVWQRRLVSGLLSCLLGGILVASPAGAALHFDFQTAFDNTYCPDTWTHLTVRVRGIARVGKALLQLRVTFRGQTSYYSRSVLLGDGSIDQRFCIPFVHPYMGTGDRIDVQLVQDDRVVASQPADIGLAYADLQQVTILCLNQDHGGLHHLNGRDLGLANRGGAPQSFSPSYGSYSYSRSANGKGGPCRIMYPGVDALPDASAAYDAIDVVVLGDIPLDALSDAQWTALRDWVRSGGLLVISGGPDVGRFRARQIADLLPIAPSVALPAVSLMPVGALGRAKCDMSLPATVGRVSPDAAVVAGSLACPLMTMRMYGSGTVVFAAFDLFAPSFRAWQGQETFWSTILKRGQAPDGLGRRLVLQAQDRYGENARWLGDVLAGLSNARPPSLQFIGGFLLLYIVCLVPLNYLLLRKWDRKELAWITAPVIVVVFTVGSYSVGAAYKGTELKLRYASVVETWAGHPEGWARTVLTVSSPRLARYTLSIGDPGAALNEVDLGGMAVGSMGTPGDLSVERGERTVLRDFRVNMWDQRSFVIGSRTDLPGSVSATVRSAGGMLNTVDVTNGTGQLLHDCEVISSAGAAFCGDLQPGQHASVQVIDPHRVVARSPNGMPVASPMWPTSGPGTNGRADDTAAGIWRVLAHMVSSPEKAAAPVLTFVGWTDKPMTGIRLDSDRPRVVGATVVVAYLPGPDGRLSPPVLLPDASAAPVRAGSASGVAKYGGRYTSTPQAARKAQGSALAMIGRGDLNGALKMAKRAHALAPQDASIMDTLADTYERRREYHEATAWYAKALTGVNPTSTMATRFKYGRTLEALKRPEAAAVQYRLVAVDPSSPYGREARRRLSVLPSSAIVTELRNGVRVVDGPGGRVPLSSRPKTAAGSQRLKVPAAGGYYVVTEQWRSSKTSQMSSIAAVFYRVASSKHP